MTRTAAVIGCGRVRDGKEGWAIGHLHALGWRAADPEIRLIGIDVSAENLKAFGTKFSLPKANLFSSTEAFYDMVVPDFVSICTWPGLHASQVMEAVKRGVRGIVCEKPAALNPAAIREMIGKCEAAGVHLAIAHQRRLNPNFQLLKKLLHEGKIGRPWMLEARVPDGWDILSWTTHWFDMANFLFDAPALSILAGLQHSGVRRYGHAVEDESVVFASYPDDNQAVFITGPKAALSPSISIRGSSGLMTTGDTPQSAVEIFSRDGFESHQPDDAEFEAFGTLLAQLIGAVERNSPMTCDACETAAATEMAYAAHESARTLRRVSLPVDFQYAPLEIIQRPSRPWVPLGKIVLYADDHFGFGGREGLSSILKEIGHQDALIIDAATRNLDNEDLSDAALLVLYHTQPEPALETRAALEKWVKDGRPLLLVHAALGAYPQWEDYKKWCGRVWAWDASEHPHEETRLVGCADWPWLDAWLPTDEVFIKLAPTALVNDLVDVEISSGSYSAAWISLEFPHIGVWVPGHRNDLWRVPAMREGLSEIIRRIAS